MTSPTTGSRDERRRGPRLQVLDRLHGTVVPMGLEMRVQDVSLGGLSVDTAIPFPAGAVHQFRLSVDGKSLVFAARVVHSQRAPGEANPLPYRTGLQFVEDAPGSRRVIETLIDRVTSVLQFD